MPDAGAGADVRLRLVVSVTRGAGHGEAGAEVGEADAGAEAGEEGGAKDGVSEHGDRVEGEIAKRSDLGLDEEVVKAEGPEPESGKKGGADDHGVGKARGR